MPRILLFVWILACSPWTASAAEAERVRNGVEPRDGRRILRLEEIWRAGHDGDDLVFGQITAVVEDGEGNVCVLDSQLRTVHVFSPDGAHLRTLFREGEGPGEVSSVRDLVRLPDGRIGALMESPGRLVLLDARGDPAGSVDPARANPAEGGQWTLMSAQAGGGSLVLGGTRSRPAPTGGSLRDNFLSLFGEDGVEIRRLCSHESVFSAADFHFGEGEHIAGFWWNTAVAPDGRVYTAPDLSRYAIRVFAPDGALERVIERDYPPLLRTPEERAAFVAMIDHAINGEGTTFRAEALDHDPPLVYTLRGLRVRHDGTLWALTGRGVRDQPDGILCTFDVFDVDGVFIRQVGLSCAGDGPVDAPFFVGEDRVVVVRGYADAFASQWFRGGRLSTWRGDDAPAIELYCYRIVD